MDDTKRIEELEREFPNGPLQKVVTTSRTSAIHHETLATTSNGLPDVLVVPLSISKRIAIRAIRTYLQSLMGFLGLAAASQATPMPLGDFTTSLTTAASLALVPTIVSILVNLLVLFTKLDDAYPELMA